MRSNNDITLVPDEIKIKTLNPKAHYDLGLIYHDQRKFNEAIICYTEVLKLKCDKALRARTYCNYGMALHELEQYEDAIKNYSAALGLQPDIAVTINACYGRGRCYYYTNKSARAVADFNSTLALKPDQHITLNCFYMRGKTYKRQGSYGLAIADYGRVLTLDSGNKKASDELNKILTTPCYDFLDVSKKVLYDAIIKLSDQDAIIFLKRCLDQNTLLGQRMWQQEGWLEPGFGCGTLKIIQDRLEQIRPKNSLATTTQSLFYAETSRPPSAFYLRCATGADSARVNESPFNEVVHSGLHPL